MKISVITPTYNSQKVIRQNIKSVLSQNYKQFEHIIVDNISYDATRSIAADEYEKLDSTDKLKIISEKDSGIADAFNKGINAASGEIITILNSDDSYHSDSVFTDVVNAFTSKDILFVHGNIFFTDLKFGSNLRKPLMCPITKAFPYNHPTMFLKKELYDKYGSYDKNFKYAMDFEFICRLIKQIPEFQSKGFYLKGEALVDMSAGGVSWKNEMATLEETKTALTKHSYWNSDARKNFFLRKLRIRIKSILTLLNLEGIIPLWRKRKWEG